jgi:hypothetical protein
MELADLALDVADDIPGPSGVAIFLVALLGSSNWPQTILVRLWEFVCIRLL